MVDETLAAEYPNREPLRVCIEVPENTNPEIELMGLLDKAIQEYSSHGSIKQLKPDAVKRAVNWLHSKYSQ